MTIRAWTRLGSTVTTAAILGIACTVTTCGGGDAPGGVGALPDGGTSMGIDEGGHMEPADAPNAPLTKRKACRDYLAVLCARQGDCSGPATGYGCLQRQAKCPDFLFSPGSTRTIESVEACLPAIRAMSCDDISIVKYPACSTPGTKMPGEACAFNTQCESLSCGAGYGNADCDTCARAAKSGESCTGSAVTCEGGLVCMGSCEAPTTHVTVGKNGDPCDQFMPCDTGLVCAGTSPNASSGFCAAAPRVGEKCVYAVYRNPSLPIPTCAVLPRVARGGYGLREKRLLWRQ